MYTDRYYATPGEDYEFQNDINITPSSPVYNFSISAEATRRFHVTIINDSIADFHREVISLSIGVYDSGRRYRCCSVTIRIEDDEGNQL